MNTAKIIQLLLKSNSLKRIQRSGWITAGIHEKNYESVASHSWGTCFISLILAKQLCEKGYEVNLGIVLELATIHDLSEIVITDIPQSAIEVVGSEFGRVKKTAEKKAMEFIFTPLEKLGAEILELWEKSQKSIESRIVAGADIIDMLVHAISLERSGVSPLVFESFFSKSSKKIESLDIPEINEMYNILLMNHRENLHHQKLASSHRD